MNGFHQDEKIPEKYALLSTGDKWKWHASIYAFRRVVLNASLDEQTSVCDTEGKWFNEPMIADAERALRHKGKNRSRSYREGSQYGSGPAGGRAVKEEWCREHGYRDFREYMMAIGLDFARDEDYAQACANIAESIARKSVMKNLREFREKKVEINDRFDAATALGVTAREYTADELRAGRIALGLEQPEADSVIEQSV